MMKRNNITNKGFAMLFTVLIMSLILSIAVGISNSTYKQTVLSSLAKDSQSAFYQADSAMECALYYDITREYFTKDLPLDQIPITLPCGDKTLEFDSLISTANYFAYVQQVSPEDRMKGCFSIIFDKSTNPLFSVVQAKGYNVCKDNPRKVERVLEVRYEEIPQNLGDDSLGVGGGVLIDSGQQEDTDDDTTPVDIVTDGEASGFEDLAHE